MDEVAHGKWEHKKTYTAVSIAILTFVLAVLLMFATPIFANPTTGGNGASFLPATKTQASLPTGEEFNSAIKNVPVLDEDGNPLLDENGEEQTVDASKNIRTITFDYYTSENAYVVDGVNLIDGLKSTELSEDVYLYRGIRADELQDLYILSVYKIATDQDSSNLFNNLTMLEEIFFNNFNTSNATTMAKMFYHTDSLLYLDLACFNTENVTDMSEMFYYCGALTLDLDSFKTENLTNMQGMFKWCDACYVDMSTFDTRNVTNMKEVFYGTSIFSLYASDLWVIPQNETSKNMFEFSRRMTGTFGTSWRSGSENYELNISEVNARLDKPGEPGYFCDVSQKLPINTPDGERMNKIIKGYVSGDKRFVTSITFDFYTEKDSYVVNGINIIDGIVPERISKDVYLYRVASGENTCDVYILSENVIHASKNLADMFENEIENPRPEGGPFYLLTKIVFNNFDTTASVDMTQMFNFCLNVEELDLSGFNTCNVKSMFNMFCACYSLKTLDVSSFNTSKVKDMTQMFLGCRSLTELDLSHFDTSNVESMYLMFSECSSLENLVITSFNTFNVSSMWSMFKGCNSLTELDLTSFSLQKMHSWVDFMFDNCTNLKAVYVSDIRFLNQCNNLKDIIKLIEKK